MRLIAGLTLLLLSLGLTGCLKRELVSNLNEHEAQEIAVVLSRSGIGATICQREATKKETGAQAGWKVEIHGAEETLIDAWQVLQQNGLPRSREKGLDEVFTDTGLIPTAGEEKAKMLVGMAGEISRTLKSLPGVVDARVHLVLPENSPLVETDKWAKPTAAVLVRYWASAAQPDEAKIREFVARGVQDLKPENVTILTARLENADSPDSFSIKRIVPATGLLLDYFYRVVFIGLLVLLIIITQWVCSRWLAAPINRLRKFVSQRFGRATVRPATSGGQPQMAARTGTPGTIR